MSDKHLKFKLINGNRHLLRKSTSPKHLCLKTPVWGETAWHYEYASVSGSANIATSTDWAGLTDDCSGAYPSLRAMALASASMTGWTDNGNPPEMWSYTDNFTKYTGSCRTGGSGCGSWGSAPSRPWGNLSFGAMAYGLLALSCDDARIDIPANVGLLRIGLFDHRPSLGEVMNATGYGGGIQSIACTSNEIAMINAQSLLPTPRVWVSYYLDIPSSIGEISFEYDEGNYTYTNPWNYAVDFYGFNIPANGSITYRVQYKYFADHFHAIGNSYFPVPKLMLLH